MSPDEMQAAALKAVMEDMQQHAKKMKAAKLMRPAAKPDLNPANEQANPMPSDNDGDEGSLADVMGKPGNSGKDIADENSLTPEELEQILSGAK